VETMALDMALASSCWRMPSTTMATTPSYVVTFMYELHVRQTLTSYTYL
jgi:hypothetical protein